MISQKKEVGKLLGYDVQGDENVKGAVTGRAEWHREVSLACSADGCALLYGVRHVI